MSTLKSLKQSTSKRFTSPESSEKKEQKQTVDMDKVIDEIAERLADRLYSLAYLKLEALACSAGRIDKHAAAITNRAEFLRKATAEEVRQQVAGITAAAREAREALAGISASLRYLEARTEEDLEEVRMRRLERLMHPATVVGFVFALACAVGSVGYVWQQKNQEALIRHMEKESLRQPMQEDKWQQLLRRLRANE